MKNRIKILFSGNRQEPCLNPHEELQTAAASLLVEAACMDGNFDNEERESILLLLKNHFNLNDKESETLVSEAHSAVKKSGQLYAFTRVVKETYNYEQRIRLIEMLWEVAFADGRLDYFESNLISRVAGLIYVSDRDRGEARKRIMANLGIS